MLWYDIKKTTANKRSLIVYTILLVMLGLLFSAWNRTSRVVPEDYRALQNGASDIEQYDAYTVQRVQNEQDALVNYDAYLTSIKEPVSSHISIFEKGTFAKEAEEKTRKAYLGKDLTAGNRSIGSYGIEQVMTEPFTDLCVFLLGIYCIYIQVDKERVSGALEYEKTMYHGGIRNYLSKLLSVVVPIALFTIIGTVGKIIAMSKCYGMADLTAPIQSVLLYRRMPYVMSIGMFLCVGTLLRILFYILVCMVFFGTVFLLKSTMITGCILSLIFFISSIQGPWKANPAGIFNFLSLPGLAAPEMHMSNVTYVSVFGHAVSYVTLYAFLFGIAGMIVFLGYQASKRPYHVVKKRRFRKHAQEPHTLRFYEIEKTWIRAGGAILGICLCLGMAWYLSGIRSLSNAEDRVIAYYIDTIGDKPTTDVYQKIQAEQERFESIQMQMEKADELEAAELAKELNAEPAFETYCMRMDALHMDTSRRVLKEDETRIFFQQDSVYAVYGMVCILLAVYLCWQSYSKEQDTGMEIIQKMTIRGRKISRQKRTAVFLLMTICLLSIDVIILGFAFHLYPQLDLSASIRDIQELNCNIPLSIGVWLVLQSLSQILVMYLFTAWVDKLFSHTKASLQIMLVVTAVCTADLILYLKHITPMSCVLFFMYPYKAPIWWILVVGISFILYKYKQRKDGHVCVKQSG